MRRHILLAAVATLACVGSAWGQSTVTIKAWTFGPEEPAVSRAVNLERAGEKLNEALAKENANYRVKVETDFDTTNWTDFKRRVLLSFESGDAPDIVQATHVDIAPWAAAGFILPLNAYIDADPRFKDIVPALWPSVTYRNNIWGIPQDTEARPLFFSKKLLRKIGWSEADLDSLPKRIQDGSFTFQDVIETSKKALAAGVIKEGNGFWHRPVNGPDLWQFMMLYGLKLADEKTGKLVFDKAIAEKALGLLQDMVTADVLDPNLTSMTWNDYQNTIATGDTVLFWSGGTWNWAAWAGKQVADRGGEAYLRENVGFALHPAADPKVGPLTLSQPQAYMITKNSKNPDVAARLLATLQDPQIEKNHFLAGLRPPVLQSSRELDEYKNNWFISRIGYMSDYALFQPLHPSLGAYSDIFFRVLTAVEKKEFDAAEGAEIMAEELKRSIGDEIEIR